MPTSGGKGPEELWYDVPAEYGDYLTETADPAVVALTVPALSRDVPLAVTGPVTDDLAFHYAEIAALYGATGLGSSADPEFNHVVSAEPSGVGVAAGFSGGVDSFALLSDHHYRQENLPDSLRLTHLLFNNVGSHGYQGERMWLRRLERMRTSAMQIGLPLMDVNSNLDDFRPSHLNYEQINTPANASVAHLLSGGLQGWIFASSVEYARVGVFRKAYNTAFVDCIALPLMTTRAISLQSSASRLRRVDKTRIISDNPDAWAMLDVCLISDDRLAGNCSRCWKCHLTMGALDVIGALPRFSSRFDLDHWLTIRENYFARVKFFPDKPLVRELAGFMDENGYSVRPSLFPPALASHSAARGRTVAGAVKRSLLRAPRARASRSRRV